MTSFKIYTENKVGAVTTIRDIVTPRYDGFNITEGIGVWKGVPEECLIVEIITDDIDRATIGEIAEEIRKKLNQETVMVSETKLSGLALFDPDGVGDMTEDERTLDDPDNDCCCENCTECKHEVEKAPQYLSKTFISGIAFSVWMDGLGRLFAIPDSEKQNVRNNPYTGGAITLKKEEPCC